MTLINYLVRAIANFLSLVEFLIFADALMSWFIKSRSNQISNIIRTIVDPILVPCHKLQAKIMPRSPIDFSPIIAIFVIEFLKVIIVSIF